VIRGHTTDSTLLSLRGVHVRYPFRNSQEPRDALGTHDFTRARPVQAALAWGAIAMVSTALIGKLVGSPV